MKKRGLVLFTFFVFVIIIPQINYAQEASDSSPEIQEKDILLSQDVGITPDSNFYFIEDKILTKFRDDITNREKKIAEVKEMVKEGKLEEGKIALERYNEFAERLEKEVSPDKQEEAKRSAKAIKRAVKELESEIPETERKEFIDMVIIKEQDIETAAEIASKIRELCQTLSKIDPEKYAITCKTDGYSPKWQKDLDSKLTSEQRKEVMAFFDIMNQCMQTSGRQCRCDDISVKAFAAKCSVVAPLAVKCDEGDESSCERINEETQSMANLLPEHLQSVFASVEEKFNKVQFDKFMPSECKEANAKTPKECMLVMIKAHAPEECVSALDSGEIKFESEREFRQACEGIMFKANAPQECIDAGIRDFKECGKLSFKANAPQECIDSGLTGEHSSDGRKCEEMMKKSEKERQKNNDTPGFNMDCRRIKDPEERLKCYDNILDMSKNNFDDFELRDEQYTQDRIDEERRDFRQQDQFPEDFNEQDKERFNEQFEGQFDDNRDMEKLNKDMENVDNNYLNSESGYPKNGIFNEQKEEPGEQERGREEQNTGSPTSSSGEESKTEGSENYVSSSNNEETSITGNVFSDISKGNPFLEYFFSR